MTTSYAGVSFRLTVENLVPFYPRRPGGRPAGARNGHADAPLGARPRAGNGRLGAARRLPRRRGTASTLDQAAPGRQGRRPGALASRAARDLERSRTTPDGAPARDRV